MMKHLLLFSLLTLLLGCAEKTYVPLPEGEQTISGILRPAELSAVRRGSHIIEQDSVNVYYAESSLINLRQYQGKRLTVRGVLEHNTDPQDLPVLVVDSVVDVEETTTEHYLEDLRLSLVAPIHWKYVKREGKHQFRLEEETEPLLLLHEEEEEELPEGGVPMVIDATRAVRLRDELTGTLIIAVKRPSTILTFQFQPGSAIRAERLEKNFLSLLDSVELDAEPKDERTTATGSTPVRGKPCGGIAGILCPDGQYCEITNFEENIGRCRSL